MNKYNANFDESTNSLVQKLVDRTPQSLQPRISRKNGETGFDQHYAFIIEKISEGKTLGQILKALEQSFGLKRSKSNLSRFLCRKRMAKNAQTQ